MHQILQAAAILAAGWQPPDTTVPVQNRRGFSSIASAGHKGHVRVCTTVSNIGFHIIHVNAGFRAPDAAQLLRVCHQPVHGLHRRMAHQH